MTPDVHRWLRAGIVVSLLAAQLGTMRADQAPGASTDQTRQSFEQADARRLSAPAGSVARATAAGDAEALAGMHAWQLHGAGRMQDAVAWFAREQQLRNERYGIWLQVLDEDHRRLTSLADARPPRTDIAAWRSFWLAAIEASERAAGAIGQAVSFDGLRRGATSMTAVNDELWSIIMESVRVGLSGNRRAALTLARQHGDLPRTRDLVAAGVETARAAVQGGPGDDRDPARLKLRRALAEALETLAQADLQQGHTDESKRHLDEALALRQSLPPESSPRVHETLGLLGGLYRETGRLREAQGAYESALADLSRREANASDTGVNAILAAALDSPADVSVALGEVLETQGHYAAALERYRIAEQQAKQRWDVVKSATLGLQDLERQLELAWLRIRTLVPLLHARLGDGESARGELQQLGNQMAAAGDTAASKATFMARLAKLDLSLGHTEQAIGVLETARAYYAGARDLPGTIYSALGLATALERTGRIADARRHADEAYQLAGAPDLATWRTRAAILSVRLRIALGLSDDVDARLAAIESGMPLLSTEDRAAGWVADGQRQEQLGRLPEAADRYRRAVREIEFLRAEPLSLDRFYDSQNHYEPYEHLLRLLLRQGNVAEAFRYALLSRSKELRQEQDDTALPASSGEHPLVIEERQLRSNMRELSGRTGGIASTATQLALGRVVERWREVTTALARESPTYQIYLEPPSLREVQADLPADTALLAYVAPLDDALSIIVVTRDRSEIVTSPVQPKDLWTQVDALRGLTSFRGSWPHFEPDVTRFRTLYDALIAPASQAIRGKGRLAILPTRGLHYVPFPALARRVGDQNRFLIEDVEIVNLSGAALGRLRPAARRSDAAAPRLTAIADPLGDLDAAREEVDAIGQLVPAPLILAGRSATPRALREGLEPTGLARTTILHVAAHGKLNATRPSASHLQLAPDETGGKLTVGEIRSLSLNDVSLVTLSACQASLGQGEPRGLAVTSLSDAFLIAGAKSVVGTLWEINDEITRDIMQAFYTQLMAGACKGTALRAAQLAVLGRPEVRHPYFWAAFSLFGDWGDLNGSRRGCTVPVR